MSIAIETGRQRSIEAGHRAWNLAEKAGSRLQSLTTAFARGSERLISKIKLFDRWLNTVEITARCRVEELPHQEKNDFLIAELGTRPAQGLESRSNSYFALVSIIRNRDSFIAPWKDEVSIMGSGKKVVRRAVTGGSLIFLTKPDFPT